MPLEPMTSSSPPGTKRAALERRPILPREEPSVWQVITLAIWVVCLAVGLLGLWMRPAPPAPKPPPAPEPPPVQARLAEVDLPPPPPPDARTLPPPPPQAALPANIPPLPIVAAPSPAIAFAVPVAGPVQIGPASMAGRVSLNQPIARVRRLSDQEADTQPKAEYPEEARQAGEQGRVGVRFVVGEDGGIVSVEVVAPSRWPLLNRAAIQVVRNRWHFRRGPVRVLDYSFNFQLI